MRVYKDKETGLYKLSPTAKEGFETKEQCQSHGINKLAEALQTIRKKREAAILGYGK
jgi:hypothetical protein